MLQSSTMQTLRVLILSLCVSTFLALTGAACANDPVAESTQAPSIQMAEPAEATPAQSFADDTGPKGVPNYTRVDATIACAGATPPEAMLDLKNHGFASIINFRTDGERGETNEAGKAAAEDAGLRYFHLPFRDPTPELAEAFLKTVTDPMNQPAYIHCGSANRVGAMWLVKRVKIDGWSVEEATAEAEAIGLRSASLKKFALDYLAGRM